jgi:hypothetical protein
MERLMLDRGRWLLGLEEFKAETQIPAVGPLLLLDQPQMAEMLPVVEEVLADLEEVGLLKLPMP